MSTAPFHPDVAALIAGPHEIGYSATATTTAGTTVLAVNGGRVSLSDKRAPRVEATLRCPLPDEATLEALDPRQRPRVALTVSYTLPDGTTDSHVVADLHLRDKRTRRTAGEMVLSLASDEALVIDSAALAGGGGGVTETRSDAAGWLRTVIVEGLWNTDYPAGPEFVIGVPRNLECDWPSDVTDYWDSITDVCDQLDLEVYDEGDRIFRIVKRPQVAAASVLTVKGGPGGILLDDDAGVTREGWANFVVLRYEWTDAAGDRQTEYGTARVTAGPVAVDTVGYKNFAEVRDGPASIIGANRAAATVLARMLSRSRALTLTTVPAWWVKPGRTITYQPRDGAAEQRHIVADVDHDLDGMTMTVTTRLPDLDSTIGE